MSELKTKLRELAKKNGFDAVGFARAQTSAQDKSNLATFNDLGYCGTMDWMHTTQERRADPNALWPQARSVIVLGHNYGPAHDPMKLLDFPERGLISCYAQNKDYHDVVKKRLKAMAREIVDTWASEVKVFVDTAPVMEKPIAAQTQLGWQGKHTCVVSRDFGSWLFLGEIFTTLEIDADEAEFDHCGSCSSCLDICPTHAFDGPGKLDARKCISYLTIEYEGVIAPELALKMGNRIYGCDDCLAVCPWNKFAVPSPEKHYHPRIELTAPRLADLVRLDESSFRTFFQGSPIKRIKRHRFIRNVLIAICNAEMRDLSADVHILTQDAHPTICETAKWVLNHWEKSAQSS